MEENEARKKYKKPINRFQWKKAKKVFLMELCKTLKLNPEKYIENEESQAYLSLKDFCLREFMQTPKMPRTERFGFMYLLCYPSSPEIALAKYNSINSRHTEFPSLLRYAQNSCARVIRHFKSGRVKGRFQEAFKDENNTQKI
jgi:hypothetical protein